MTRQPSVQFFPLLLLSAISFAAPTAEDWKALNASVAGKLFQHAPFARSCFQLAQTTEGSFNQAQCAQIQTDYLDTFARADNAGSYEGTQWESCQAKNESCLLDTLDPTNPAAFAPPKVCSQGSVPSYFIEVQSASDVQAAFKFVKKTGVELVIKNTGHDYQGRSARPGSLALWTRHLTNAEYNPAWRPQGCPISTPPRTVGILGSGVDLVQILNFTDSKNISIPGGACGTVSPMGGYAYGGGHSALSNTFGLAADRSLQFTVVIPSGEVLVANACQNTDLYFALRGGGGGTFGVVLEVVTLAFPRTPLQTFTVNNMPTDPATTRAFWKIITDNSIAWSQDGWGGYVSPLWAQYVNPSTTLTSDEVNAQLAPLRKFAESVNATVSQVQMESFTEWFNVVLKPVWSITGSQTHIASRLVPRENFATAQSRQQLLDAVLEAGANATLPVMLISTPFSYKPDGLTSVTPAWRKAVWHYAILDDYNFDTPNADIVALMNSQQQKIQLVRDITPGSGAYLNEAHIHEPNFQESFWGENYGRLLQIKRKYDPDHVLDCWHCVGWKGITSPSYKCYI